MKSVCGWNLILYWFKGILDPVLKKYANFLLRSLRKLFNLRELLILRNLKKVFLNINWRPLKQTKRSKFIPLKLLYNIWVNFHYRLYRSACVAWSVSWLADSGSSDSSSRSKSVSGNSQRQNEFDRCWREAADCDLN